MAMNTVLWCFWPPFRHTTHFCKLQLYLCVTKLRQPPSSHSMHSTNASWSPRQNSGACRDLPVHQGSDCSIRSAEIAQHMIGCHRKKKIKMTEAFFGFHPETKKVNGKHRDCFAAHNCWQSSALAQHRWQILWKAVLLCHGLKAE